MAIKIIDGVNLKEILGSRFVESNKYFECSDDDFDEYIYVDKITREIRNCGFNGLIYGLANAGLIEVCNERAFDV